MDDRPATWVAAGGYAAVLRKHKNFSRGGAQLELFSLERECRSSKVGVSKPPAS